MLCPQNLVPLMIFKFLEISVHLTIVKMLNSFPRKRKCSHMNTKKIHMQVQEAQGYPEPHESNSNKSNLKRFGKVQHALYLDREKQNLLITGAGHFIL